MNQTRFLILDKNEEEILADYNKASLKLTVGHHQGALATALNVLSDCQLNLTKIQSVPIVEQPWNFYMFVEVKSILSDDVRSKEIDVNLEQVRAWMDGALIQDAMPNVTPEDRDFFKGIFWDEL